MFPLASALRARQVPFAFLTGYDASRLPPEYRDYPLLSKPFAMNQFTRMVATFVAAAAPSVAGVAADSVSA